VQVTPHHRRVEKEGGPWFTGVLSQGGVVVRKNARVELAFLLANGCREFLQSYARLGKG
jgi:hypothetical protein